MEKAELLRDMDANLLPTFLRFQELVRLGYMHEIGLNYGYKFYIEWQFIF